MTHSRAHSGYSACHALQGQAGREEKWYAGGGGEREEGGGGGGEVKVRGRRRGRRGTSRGGGGGWGLRINTDNMEGEDNSRLLVND